MDDADYNSFLTSFCRKICITTTMMKPEPLSSTESTSKTHTFKITMNKAISTGKFNLLFLK